MVSMHNDWDKSGRDNISRLFMKPPSFFHKKIKELYRGGSIPVGYSASPIGDPAVFTHDAPGKTICVHTCFPVDQAWWLIVCNWGGGW